MLTAKLNLIKYKCIHVLNVEKLKVKIPKLNETPIKKSPYTHLYQSNHLKGDRSETVYQYDYYDYDYL